MDANINLPNLFIVGAAKCGTTSLHNYLKQHPDIFMTEHKEPHFLINSEIGERRVHKAVTTLEAYKKMFATEQGYRYKGESSVMYLMFPEIVIPKINQQFGEDCKIIIMLRNPIERAYSGFQHVRRYNAKEDCSDFKSAWTISEERYFSNPEMTPASRYKELGLYYKQVKSYLDGMKNVHIIMYDDYKKDVQFEMNKVFDFLEIKNVEIDSQKRYMAGGWQWENQRMKNLLVKKNLIKSFLKVLIPFKGFRKKIRTKIQNRNTSRVPQICQDDIAMLKAFYKKDVEQLSILLERDLNYWTE